jgi:hypothetical protein
VDYHLFLHKLVSSFDFHGSAREMVSTFLNGRSMVVVRMVPDRRFNERSHPTLDSMETRSPRIHSIPVSDRIAKTSSILV